MSASRKGLKRRGMGAYELTEAGITYVLRRIGSRKWAVRPADVPDLAYDFFAVLFRTLRDARKFAHDLIFPGNPRKRIRQMQKRYRSDPNALKLAAKLIAKSRETSVKQ